MKNSKRIGFLTSALVMGLLHPAFADTSVSCPTGYSKEPLSSLDPMMTDPGWTSQRRYRSFSGSYDSNDTTGLAPGDWERTNFFGVRTRGIASCNNTSGNSIWSDSPTLLSGDTFNKDSSGQYCWCQITGYSQNDTNITNFGVSDWISRSSVWTMSDCAIYCPVYCADYNGVNYNTWLKTFSTDNCKPTVYNCWPGTYFNPNTLSCQKCPAGSYCSGGDQYGAALAFEYDGQNHGVTNSCPSGYTSETGARDIYDCYRPCSLSDVGENATAVSGKYFYGDNNQCIIDECSFGNHKKQTNDYITKANQGKNGFVFEYGALSADGYYYSSGGYTKEYLGLTEPNTWATDLGFGIFYGRAMASDTFGIDDATYGYSTRPSDYFSNNSTGRYCWCKITGYKADINDAMTQIDSVWVYQNRNAYNAHDCSRYCATGIRYYSSSLFYRGFRYTLFKSADIEQSRVCVAGYDSSCDAGYYLNGSKGQCLKCPSGYYCSGGDFEYDGNDHGLDTCPTGYTSDTGSAASINDCYRSCATTDVAHSASVSGKYYYGDNNQCEPTSCEKGYNNTNLLLSFITMSNEKWNSYYSLNQSGNPVNTYGNNSSLSDNFNRNLTEANTWKTDLGFGTFYGNASCNTISGSMDSDGDHRSTGASDSMSRDTSGQYCWCQLTAYENTNGDAKSAISSWVYADSFNDLSQCGYACSMDCAQLIRYYSNSMFYQGFRFQLLSTASYSNKECEINTYTCESGTYLDNTTETCVECPAGSFCEGGTFTYNGNDQGISGSCPSEYPLSDSASSVKDCYRECINSDVPGASAVSGKYYYGDNNQCVLGTCASGWTKQVIDFSGLDTSEITFTNSAFVNYNGNLNEGLYNGGEFKGQDFYGITQPNTWATNFDGWGTIRGIAKESSTPSAHSVHTNDPDILASIDDTYGSYCYCKVTGYRAEGETNWTDVNSDWMFNVVSGICAQDCSTHIGLNASARNKLLRTVSSASCSANTLNINWYDLDSLVHTGSCTYGQTDIVLPENPTPREGFIFRGWRLVNE